MANSSSSGDSSTEFPSKRLFPKPLPQNPAGHYSTGVWPTHVISHLGKSSQDLASPGIELGGA